MCVYLSLQASCISPFSRSRSLPPRSSPKQYNSAWVLCQLGRAHFERMDYDLAASMFEAARSADRHRVEGMELYSTVLWHTKRDYELSYLAQDVVALDRLAPQV